jgi:hypothetical protein
VPEVPRGLPGLIDALLNALDVHPAPWVGSAGVVVVVLFALPMVRKNLRTDRARRLLKEAGRARSPERERLEAEALDVVADEVHGLIVVGDTALATGRRALAEQVLARLRTLRGVPREATVRLERGLDPDAPATPLDAVLRVERLREAGAHAAADALLARARARWPDDEELKALG